MITLLLITNFMFWSLLNVYLNASLLIFTFFWNITQVLLKQAFKCLTNSLYFFTCRNSPISNIISLNILFCCSFSCDCKIISWNFQTKEAKENVPDGKVQVILSNSSSLVSTWVQLSGGAELWMHVCVHGWETGPGLVFRPHLGEKPATLRCSDWSLSAVVDFKIRVWSEEFCLAQFTSTSQRFISGLFLSVQTWQRGCGNLHSSTKDLKPS